MSLGSVMHTARTGISAVETAVSVMANNMANAQTPGFKASQVTLAARAPRTESHGAAPSGSSGGTNPVQVGSGVGIAAISTDSSQGSMAMGRGPAEFARQSDVFSGSIQVLDTAEQLLDELTGLSRPD